MALTLGTALRNAMADAAGDRFDAGSGPATIQVRTGSKPANPQASATGTLLFTFTLQDPAWGAASNGVKTLDNTPVSSPVAVSTGTAGWFRVLDSNSLAVLDGTVGTSGTDMIMDNPAVVTGQTINLNSGTLTQPE